MNLTEEQISQLEVLGLSQDEIDVRLNASLQRAIQLNLLQQPHMLWCLDISAHIPFFAFIANSMGHDCLSTLVGVEYAEALGCSAAPSKYAHKFDLITVFDKNLEYASESQAREDTRRLIDLLVPGGRLVVSPSVVHFHDYWVSLTWWGKLVKESEATVTRALHAQEYWVEVKVK